MYQVPFEQIVAKAKEQTGFNLPQEYQVRAQLMTGEAQHMICVAAQMALRGHEHVVADDDDAHYAMEEVISQACMAIWDRQERDNNRMLNSRR